MRNDFSAAMPSDALTVAVTTGLGVSVVAGILSGICYILTQGLPRRRTRKSLPPWHCNVCHEQFRSIQGVLEVEKVVTCAKCKEKVCRVRCSRRDPKRGWLCQVCLEPETWFTGLLKAIHPNNPKGWCRNKIMDPNRIDELDEDLLELRKKEREQVRDFIERLVESMLGGNLDDVSVRRVYNDKKYDGLFVRYHADLSNALTDLGSALHISISNLPITGQSPCSAHASLKQLIQRFIQEAVDLPELKRNIIHPATPEEEQSDRTYEDLLSTAIINKVVESYQNETSKSSTNSVSSRASCSSKKANSNKEYFFSDETLDTKWKDPGATQDDTSSVSSLDDWAKSDSSVGSSKYIDRVSLTIKQRIEEKTSSDDEEALPNGMDSDLNSLLKPNEMWNENWYLQKRHISGSNSPVPVPMLVPNPTVEAKVLIGDREAEDTSDLSDIGSDYGDPEVVPDIKNILVTSRTIIGGKNLLENAVVGDDGIVEDISINTSEEAKREENCVSLSNGLEEEENYFSLSSRVEAEGKCASLSNGLEVEQTHEITQDSMLELSTNLSNNDEVDSKNIETKIEDSSLLSLDSNTEQDTEYTEQYGSLPRTIMKSPKPTPRTSKLTEIFKEEPEEQTQVTAKDTEYSIDPEDKDMSESSDEDSEKKMKMFKGTYSEREKEKWKHAVEMPNNPYTSANLERRLSNRSDDSCSSLFGRDYYVREAAKSTGARKKVPFNHEATDDHGTLNGDEPEEQIQVEGLVKAIPVYIEPAEPKQFESSSETSTLTPTRPNHLEISSDSDLSIERIYNFQSGKIIQKIGSTTQEVVKRDSESPKGIKYTPLDFDQEFRKEHLDENHNNTGNTNSKRREFLRSLTQSDADEDTEIINEEVLVPITTNTPTPHRTLSPMTDRCKYALQDESTVVASTVPYSNTKQSVLKEETVHNNVLKREPSNHEIIEHKVESKYFGNMKKLVENKVISPVTNDMVTSDYSEEDALSENKDFSLEYSTDVTENDVDSQPEGSMDASSEIQELIGKHLVSDVLGKYSKSSLTQGMVSNKSKEQNIKESDSALVLTDGTESDNGVEIDEVPSVKNLKKMFDNKINQEIKLEKNAVQVHSLTARSISKQFRNELKSHEEISNPRGDSPLIENTEDLHEEEELLADITKNRIAFFENLKSK